MISEEKFTEILAFIQEEREKWNKLQDAMEDLSPGEYVNFWPYFKYEDKIIDLLNEMFNMEDNDAINLFICEGEFGDKPEYLTFTEDDVEIDISDIKKLYNYCLKQAKL